MPVTTLDRRSALIIVDLQNAGLAVPRAPIPMEEVIANSRKLANAFRSRRLPVVLVKVVGRPPGRTEGGRGGASPQRSADQSEIVAGLGQRSEDHVVEKRSLGAFWDTDLRAYLAAQSVTQVVITGCATSLGVDSTAREAFASGLNVTIAADAVSDVSADAHVNACTRIFPRIAEIGTTQEILDHLSSASG